jgi:2-dehydro-3-deoxy-L-fuconate 4-dehydrogenase
VLLQLSQGNIMTDRLKGKLAFCTAAAAGIGRATAIAFAREGARVIASDINKAGMAGLTEAGVAECVALDARDAAAIEAQAKRLGAVDALFNAAGFVHHGSVLDATDQEWDFAFDLNVKSMHRTIKAFLPGMLQAGRGSIVNIASTVGAAKAAPNRYIYGASKAAVVGLTKAVAIDFIGKGIRCNCICPGTIATPSLEERIRALGRQLGSEEKAREMFIARQPMGRLGTAEEIAYVAVYLASDESAYMTGSAIIPDGGFTL